MSPARASAGRHLIDGAVRTFAAEALIFPTGLVTAGVLTRGLHPAGYGLFTLAAVLIAWMEGIIPALFSRASVKFVSDATDKGPVSTAVLRLYLGTGLAVATILWLLAPWIGALMAAPALSSYLRLFAFEIPIVACSGAHRNILVGMGAYRRLSVVGACKWPARGMVLMVLFVVGGLSVRGAILGSIGACVVELAATRHFVQPSLFSRTAVPVRSLCTFAMPLFLAAICARLFDRIDLFAFKALGASAAQAGYYGSAQNAAMALNLASASFAPLLLGTLARLLSEGDRAKAVEIGGNAVRMAFCLAPFVAVAFGASGELVRAVYGPSFAPAAPLIGPLVAASMALLLVAADTALIVAADKPSWTLLFTVPLPFVAMAGHLVLIPRLGAWGASMVTMNTAFLSAGLASVQTYLLWKIRPPWTTLARSAAISALAWLTASAWHVPTALLPVKLAALALLIAVAFGLTGEFGDPRGWRSGAGWRGLE